MRLYPLTDDTPKWLIPYGNRTIADYQLKWLDENGVNKVIVTLNRKYALAFKPPHCPAGIRLEIHYEEKPTGDEGSLKEALKYTSSDEVYVVNCDILTDLSLNMVGETPALVLVHPQSPWGVYYDDGNFTEKPVLPLWVSSGIYKFPKSIREELADGGMLARNIIPKLLMEKRLNLAKYNGYWKAIETQKDLANAQD